MYIFIRIHISQIMGFFRNYRLALYFQLQADWGHTVQKPGQQLKIPKLISLCFVTTPTAATFTVDK